MGTETIYTIDKDRLCFLLEEIESLEATKTDVSEKIAACFGNAKSEKFDVGAMKYVLKLRRMNAEEAKEHEHLLDVYKNAVGIV